MNKETETTPIRRQYLELKRKYADCILFFRLGDFFETFDADAELVARELDVVLTSRPVGKDSRIPMAGVPHHAADAYIARLIERGYRVAIADQIGNETVNGLVPREVRQVVTPGTVVDPVHARRRARELPGGGRGRDGRLIDRPRAGSGTRKTAVCRRTRLLRYHHRRVLGDAAGQRGRVGARIVAPATARDHRAGGRRSER